MRKKTISSSIAYVLISILLISLDASADQIRLLAENITARQARADIIQQAQHEILAEYFSISNDGQALELFALLLQAAERGVHVRILTDAFMTSVPKALISALLGRTQFHNPPLNFEFKVYNLIGPDLPRGDHRDHAKMLIVDNKIMISGGRNVGDGYFGLKPKGNFVDMDALITGSVVNTARDNFMLVWNSSISEKPWLFEKDPDFLLNSRCMYSEDTYQSCQTLRDSALKQYQKESERLNQALERIASGTMVDGLKINSGTNWLTKLTPTEFISFSSHQPDKLVTQRNNHLTHDLMKFADSATKEFDIITPYFVPTPEMIELFQKLISRGVNIRIITNSLRSTDVLMAQLGYRKMRKELVRLGLELYEYNKTDVLHAKILIVDHERAAIGTYNWDYRSAQINREIAFAVDGAPEFIRDLSEQFEIHRKESLLVGKGGREYNQEKEFENLPESRLSQLKLLKIIVPLVTEHL